MVVLLEFWNYLSFQNKTKTLLFSCGSCGFSQKKKKSEYDMMIKAEGYYRDAAR